MSSLKEKTKTSCEEKCQFYYSPSFVCNMRNQCPLLERLEDTQKELLMLNLKNKTNYALAEARSRKLDEWKQKLRQFPKPPNDNSEKILFIQWATDIDDWLANIKELLKEEKEARP